MKLKDLYYDNFGIARAIVESDSGNEYVCNADGELYRMWCSCPYYLFHPNTSCKHIKYLLNHLEYNKMVRKNFIFVETKSPTIDDLLGGGVPYGIVTAVYGEPMSGKSMFGHQMGLANIAKTGKKTLLIETEGLRNYDVKLILYKFMKRWGLTKEQVDENYIINHTMGNMQLQSIQVLLKMFGTLPKFDISDNGKYTVTFQDNLKPLIKDDELKDVGMIIIDSFTKPIKDSVGSNTQNLPCRSALTERLFNRLYHVAMIHNIAVIVNHHASYNPVMPFGRDLGKPYGGDPILYNSKYAIEFIDAPKKLQKETGWGNECRRVKLLRRPDRPSTDELFPVRLRKDWGYTDE